ncbi:tetratricopeptide repeat protein [Mongoliitalea daihaiensis]|uniref:tetratricopeptide repeat protein n=1 Tax=Mongoliitalea daihaiensis TaxID=2782006 RepID=UPI001F397FBA|nr:tetratricopeptide repeat protein [Mongoliitalea daihaiensis]UJP65140.1 tetratricopeptide repeat-containing sensor histidine kinase [Mongoliitalea daihaiensis]
MRVFLVTFAFLLISLNTYAQKDRIEQLIQKGIGKRYSSVDSAHFFIDEAEKIAKETGLFTDFEAQILLHRAGNNYVAGRYVASMGDYKKAYTLLENTINQKTDLIRAMNGLGLIELAQHNYQSAVNYWEKCLALSYEVQDSVSMIRTHFNLGLGLSELERFPEAIEQLEKAINMSIQTSDNTLGMMSTNRLAYVYYQLEDLELAFQLYEQVLLQAAESNSWEQAFAYTGIAEVLLKQNQMNEALKYALQGYESAKLVGAFWDKQRASAVLTQVYEQLGQYSKALAFAKINKQMGDSLYSRDKATEINFLKLQLANSENLKLNQEKAAIQKQNNLYSFISGILIIFIALLGIGTWVIIRNNRQKSKLNEDLAEANHILEEQKRQIEEQNNSLNEINQAKNKLFSILSHDLRSPLNSIKQFMELEKQNLFSEEEKLKAKDMMYQQVHQTDRLLNNLLEWSKSQLEGLQTSPSSVDLRKEMQEIIRRFDFQIQLKNIVVEHQAVELPTAYLDKNHLRIILQNVFHNAIKFSPVASTVHIQYTLHKNTVAINIQDSGKGMTEEQRKILESSVEMASSTPGTSNETGTGLGIYLVKQFIQINGGALQIESSLTKGTTFILQFPLTTTIKDQNTSSYRPAWQSAQA